MPPASIESLQRIEPPWRAIKEWIPDKEPNLAWIDQPQGDLASRQHSCPDEFDKSPVWKPEVVQLGEELRANSLEQEYFDYFCLL
ncbi:MAG: hypothetical protein JHD00_05670 [Akkermansiaceae bacterium]|nr:hypothetical protein [Akkermansiaceae bacterium]